MMMTTPSMGITGATPCPTTTWVLTEVEVGCPGATRRGAELRLLPRHLQSTKPRLLGGELALLRHPQPPSRAALSSAAEPGREDKGG